MRSFLLTAVAGLALPMGASKAVAASAKSSCGSHALELRKHEAVFDGRSIVLGAATRTRVAQPVWRRDCGAVAWLEETEGAGRLVVVTLAGRDVDVQTWQLSSLAPRERIFWADATTVTVGEALLRPRMVARLV